MKFGRIFAAAASLLLADTAWAAEIKVLSSGGTKEAYLELVPQFEKGSEHRAVTTWSGTVGIKKRIADGEAYDLVIVGAPEIDAFIQQGKMVPGSRVSSSDALKKTLLEAKSIGYSTGPSGVYIASLFESMGIADQVKAKLKQTPSGVAVGSIIANGEVEIGFQQVSELIHFPGVDYVGPLPSARARG